MKKWDPRVWATSFNNNCADNYFSKLNEQITIKIYRIDAIITTCQFQSETRKNVLFSALFRRDCVGPSEI